MIWASTDSSVATVTGSGLVRSVAEGTATITAGAGTVSDSAGVAVYQEVAGVVVHPATMTLEVGDTLRLAAEAQDVNGNPVGAPAFVWMSGNEYVATVDSAGLVRARVRGDATITAALGTLTGTANLTVTLPHIPPSFAVDEGTSHSLQFRSLYVSHRYIRSASFDIWPGAISYADFNDDGLVDIFYSPSDGSTSAVSAEVYINDGMGGFDLDGGLLGVDPPGGVAPRKALPGDFNGDGRPDVFVVDHGYDHPPFPGAAPFAVLSSDTGYVKAQGLDGIIGFHHGGASADIDADGDLDVLVTDNRSFFLVNDGTGNFVWDPDRIEGIESDGIFTAELVDVDRDGYVDVLAAGNEYQGFPTQILWGDNTGVFSTMGALILPAIPGHGIVVDIDVADTDGDGDKDIVLNRTGDPLGPGPGRYKGYYLQLLEQTGTRIFSDITQHLLQENQHAEADWILWLRIFDLDEDGDPDIFADEASTRLLWKNDGSGRFRRGLLRFVPPNHAVDEGSSHSLQNPPFRIDHRAVRNGRPGWAEAWAYGDFDGDGHFDVFYAPKDGSSRPLPAELYVNDGNGTFSLDRGFMDGSPPEMISPRKAIPGDYNGDGRLDVLVSGDGHDFGGESPYVVLSTGSGHVLGRLSAEATGVNIGGAAADVDADGDLDVFLSGPGSVLLNDGSDSFGHRGGTNGPVEQIEGLGQFVIAAEFVDVNSDGYADLLVGGHEQGDGPTQIIWGDSSGVYSTSGSTVLPAVAGHGVVLDIDVADTDGDGDKDIVVTRTGDETGIGFYQGYYMQLVENVGHRTFSDATSALMSENRDDRANSLKWMRLYDVDGDSDVDIVVDHYSGTDLVWKNDGAGRFRRDH